MDTDHATSPGTHRVCRPFLGGDDGNRLDLEGRHRKQRQGVRPVDPDVLEHIAHERFVALEYRRDQIAQADDGRTRRRPPIRELLCGAERAVHTRRQRRLHVDDLRTVLVQSQEGIEEQRVASLEHGVHVGLVHVPGEEAGNRQGRLLLGALERPQQDVHREQLSMMQTITRREQRRVECILSHRAENGLGAVVKTYRIHLHWTTFRFHVEIPM